MSEESLDATLVKNFYAMILAAAIVKIAQDLGSIATVASVPGVLAEENSTKLVEGIKAFRSVLEDVVLSESVPDNVEPFESDLE